MWSASSPITIIFLSFETGSVPPFLRRTAHSSSISLAISLYSCANIGDRIDKDQKEVYKLIEDNSEMINEMLSYEDEFDFKNDMICTNKAVVPFKRMNRSRKLVPNCNVNNKKRQF